MALRAFALPGLTAAGALLLAVPAQADCLQQIEMIDQAVVAAETGASAEESGMPATKHQEQVLSGEARVEKSDMPSTEHQQEVLSKPDEDKAAAGSLGDSNVASPHQRQVTGLDDATREQASSLVDEARRLADAGQEEACMDKVAEAKELIGVE